MPETEIDRKSRFRAALALAKKTAEAWAEENDVTPGHLSLVLAGKRESQSLTEKIEAFTEQYLGAA
jgi:histidinol dehydrogenase